MKRNIVILLFVPLFLAGCVNTKEKIQEKDYSKFSFTDISWTRDAENDVETIVFKSDGRFTYYCSCGNPVNDSDLCETYTYNEDTNEIILDCLEETKETVTNIKIVNSTETILELNFNGEIRKFEKYEQKNMQQK